MYKILIIAMGLSLLPSGASATDQDPMAQKTLLEKLSSLQVFNLRLPLSVKRTIQKEKEEAAAQTTASPDSCHVRSNPQHRGSVDYSCDKIKSSIKKELSSVAAN